MRSYIIPVVLVSIICAAGIAFSQRTGLRHGHVPPGNNPTATIHLNAVALNASAPDRTFTIDNPMGFATFTAFVDYTHANNGTLTLTCTASDDNNVTPFTLTTCVVASGICTLKDAGVYVTDGALTGDKQYVIPVGIRGYPSVECILDHGGAPNGSDLVTLTGFTITQ